MSGQQNVRILAGRPTVDFVGRATEANRLAAHARSTDGLLILATPGCGATELLKQTYDRLFRDQQDVVPIYFSIRRNFSSAREIAQVFLDEFIRQLIAFRRQDATIIRSASGLDELSELSLSLGGFWIDRVIETARSASSIDERSFIRTCLGAPIRAAASGERSFLMFDDVHELANIEGGIAFLDAVNDLLPDSGVSYAFSGNRRFLFGKLDCDRLELDHLKLPEAGQLVEVLAKADNLTLTEPARDLIATQLGGNATLCSHLVRTARDAGLQLESFEDVEKAYTNALFGGRIARDLDRIFVETCGETRLERRVVALLAEMRSGETQRMDRAIWRRRLQLTESETDALLARLNISEIIQLTSAHVETMSDNIALSDYISTRLQLEATPSRAAIFGDALTAYIRRAPEILARVYRANWSVGVREVLGAFAGQRASSYLLDYGAYRDVVKGLPNDEVAGLIESSPRIDLPRIFFTTNASAFYRPIAQIAETERAAIALGFEVREDSPDADVVWIAAEVDSKLEAPAELAEFWCDRLEAAAMMCGFSRFKIWLIAPEGFTAQALEILQQRDAYGSSRRQVDLLRKFLNAAPLEQDELADNEYEMVIPMGDDAELIAAHAVEEVAKRHKFDTRSINQIKTALVEACINASEHSLSPDGKIYQRFRVDDDRVVLTVSNRGLRLAPGPSSGEPHEGRRGWGLKLMRQLMDDVRIEHVDDGTRIVMTKLLNADRVPNR